MPAASESSISADVPDTVQLGAQEVRLRDSSEGDEAQIVGVFEAAFGSFYASAKPVDGAGYIRWFAERHESHQTRIKLAEIDSRIVSASAGLRRTIKVGPRTLFGVAGGIGNATLPEYQGRGIATARGRWGNSVQHPPKTVSVTTVRARGQRPRKDDVPASGRMGVYLYVLRPWRAARAKSDANTALTALPATALAVWSRGRSLIGASRSPEVTVRTLPAFDERFASFLEEASAAWDIIPIRSIEYLNWRFCDPRAGAFSVRAAEVEGELAGYSVLHAVGARGHIMDLLALPGRLDVMHALVTDAVRQLRQAGSAAVECWMLREQPYAGILRQAGFVRLPGRSAEIAAEVGWKGSGLGPDERTLLMSPSTSVHLVRADFDGI